jgi:hypothetical protein
MNHGGEKSEILFETVMEASDTYESVAVQTRVSARSTV